MGSTQDAGRRTQDLPWREIIGAIVILVSRVVTAPRTPWENDEFLFAAAVRKFDPSLYHPHPPGYPLYVLIGKVFNAVVNDPWWALVLFSIIAAPIGFVAMARAFRKWIDDPDIAVSGALLYYFSASMLVHGTLALSDGPSIMFLGLALLALSRLDESEHERAAIALGIWSSAAIGCRPQLVVPLVPMLLIALWRMRTMRQRVACALAFGFLSLMWLLPLIDAAGGWQKLMAYESKQAAYFASHDAAMSRGAKTSFEIVTRFVLHPWGSKYITIPLLLAILLGLPALARRWRPLLPLLVFSAVQLAFEIAWMDPADGSRYSLPVMILFALAAASGFAVIRNSTRLRAAPYIAAAFFAAISLWYVKPIIAARTRQPSPVAAAAAHANAHFAPNTVIAYELSLRPHAEYLMSRFRTAPIEPAVRQLYDKPEVPLVLFADGGSRSAEARVFAWPESDAYGKLTRNHYRVVTLDPIRPEERYLPEEGMYALERTIAGDEWRWLARRAVIRLPRLHRGHVTLTFRLSPDTPYDTNVVHLAVNGRAAGEVTARKEAVSITIAVPAEPVEITMQADQAFAPATVLHNQDPRILAVQLIGVVQSP